MKKNYYPARTKVKLLFALIISNLTIFFTSSAYSQITPDNTLGAERSIVTPNGNVQGLPATLIQGGATRGVNLFQSFSQFNVGDGQRVYFANPQGIQNILSRITGGNPSNILGTLGVNGKANLFFLNPNGIVFGPNARLDVAGSFFASTANSFVFDNGLQFSATNPEAPPLITVSIRPGLQFGANSSTITNTGNLQTGQDLTLAGVKLDLQGKLEAGKDLTLSATDTVKVRDTATNPFIASAGGKLLLQGNQNVDIFALNHPNSGFFSGSDMVLRSANTVGGDAHYWANGNFRIEKLDGNAGNLFSPYDPVIRALGDVNIGDYEGFSLHILAGGSVTLADVTITGADSENGLVQEITLSDETPLKIDGKEQPTLDIRAGTTDFGTPGQIPNPIPGINGVVNTNAPSTSADITIRKITNINNNNSPENADPIKGQILLTNQYFPNGLTGDIETGDITTYGNVTIDSRGTINTTGTVDISLGIDSGNNIQFIANGNITTRNLWSDFAKLDRDDIGNGGNITLISKNGAINTTNGQIFSTTDNGIGGDVTIKAAGDININNDIKASSNSESSDFTKIIIQSDKGSVFLNNSRVSTSNVGTGFAGDVIITAHNQVLISADNDISQTPEDESKGIFSEGNLGNIYIGNSEGYPSFSPQKLEVINSILSTNNLVSSQQEADSGSISIISIDTGSLSLNGARIQTNTEIRGNAGNITINATSGGVDIKNGSFISSVVQPDGNGYAGFIDIKASGAVTLDNKSIIFNNVEDGAIGDAGFIDIEADSVSLKDNSELQSLVRNQTTPDNEIRKAGYIKIKASNAVTLNNSSIFSSLGSETRGDAGNIQIEANSVSLDNGARLKTNVENQTTPDNEIRNTGFIYINALNGVTLDNSSISTSLGSGTRSNAEGYVSITTSGGAVSLNNEANIQAQTQGTGNAGYVSITTSGGAVSLNNKANIQAQTQGTGNAGNVSITTSGGAVSLNNKANIQAQTQGTGNAGDVSIATSGGAVSLDQGSSIFSSVEDGAIGNAGFIDIKADSVSLKNNSQLQSSVKNQTTPDNEIRNAGYININAPNGVTLDNSSIFTSLGSGTRSNEEGYVSITTDGGAVSLDQGSLIFSSVENGAIGQAGDILIKADLLSLDNASKLDSSTLGNGAAGFVSITANNFKAQNGGQVQTNTAGSGNAGEIKLQVTNNVTFSGFTTLDNLTTRNSYYVDENNRIPSGLFARTSPNSTGKGGSIFIDPDLVTIEKGARVAVDSDGSGDAGQITLLSNRLILDERGRITANTNNGQGGGITLNLRDLLLMRRNSSISTDAGRENSPGNGGNITINAQNGFIVGLANENNDITANAFRGSGGVVNITTTGVFGLKPNPQLTPFSDITAISQTNPSLNGIVNINSPDIDISDSLVSLPEDPIDASRLIAQACSNIAGRGSQFINAGRGGLPPRPDEPLNSAAVWKDTRLTATPTQQQIPTATNTTSKKAPIAPATGWVFNGKGEVTLVSAVPESNSSLFNSNTSICPVP